MLLKYLYDPDIGNAIWSIPAAVYLNVLQPLNVRLGITVNFTKELGITTHYCGSVFW